MSESASQSKRYGDWLRSGDTGISSEAIFHFMTLGIAPSNYPHDPADFARCLRLILRFPEWEQRLPEMGRHCPKWKALAQRWTEVEATFVQEAGGKIPDEWDRWSAPKTYDLMKEIGL